MLVQLVAFLVNLEFQCLVVDLQLSVLVDELLHDVAVVYVYLEDLIETKEDFTLNAILRVDEGSELLCEVDSLVNGDLCSLFLVLVEQEGQSLDHEAPGCVAIMKLGTVFEHIVVLNQLG